MKKLVILVFFATLTACSDDNGGSDSAKSKTVNVGIVTDDTWTYISLTTGKVVGTSAFDSAAGDSLWSKRADWDVALCGSLLRTNGGTSGIGNGAVARVHGTSYESISDTVAADFVPDSIYTITKSE